MSDNKELRLTCFNCFCSTFDEETAAAMEFNVPAKYTNPTHTCACTIIRCGNRNGSTELTVNGSRNYSSQFFLFFSSRTVVFMKQRRLGYFCQQKFDILSQRESFRNLKFEVFHLWNKKSEITSHAYISDVRYMYVVVLIFLE